MFFTSDGMKPDDAWVELQISRRFSKEPFFNEHFSSNHAFKIFGPNSEVILQLDRWVEGPTVQAWLGDLAKSSLPQERKRELASKMAENILRTALQGLSRLTNGYRGLIYDLGTDDIILEGAAGLDPEKAVEEGRIVFIDADGGKKRGSPDLVFTRMLMFLEEFALEAPKDNFFDLVLEVFGPDKGLALIQKIAADTTLAGLEARSFLRQRFPQKL